MPPSDRYEFLRVLREGARSTDMSRDTWTGARVVVKRGPAGAIAHEASVLLSLPAGVGPRLLDVAFSGEEARLAMEWIEGRTLLQSAPGIPSHEVPALVRDLCVALAHLHRAGGLHCDLKPGNVMLEPDGGNGRPRLLDFGFSRAAAPYASPEEEPWIGGTPPFVAPEILKGWAIDGRADLYSLGVTLRILFPELGDDGRWGGILPRLTDERPSRRFGDAVALRRGVEERFGLDPARETHPPWTSGPMRERTEEVRDVLEALSGSALVAVHARPGTGLTRFLLECAMAFPREQASSELVLLDAGEATLDLERAVRSAEASLASGSGVLVGIPDLSPALRWTAPERAAPLRRLLQAGASHLELRALPASAFDGLVRVAVGAGAPSLGAELHAWSGGDLRAADGAFRGALRTAGSETGIGWSVDEERAIAAVRALPQPEQVPALARLSAGLARAVRITARCRDSVPEETLDGLLAVLAPGVKPADLVRQGVARREGDRIALRPRRLWQDAREAREPDAEAVDRWLHEHWEPDASRPREVVESVRRALALGDAAAAGRRLDAGLAEAQRRGRSVDVRELVFPADKGASAESARESVASAARLTGRDEAELRTQVGEALLGAQPDVAVDLLEESAAKDSPLAVDALRILVRHGLRLWAAGEVEAHLDALEESNSRWNRLPDGAIPLERGAAALRSGRAEEARKWAARGREHLRGTGTEDECRVLQLIAMLQADSDPDAAAATLQSALVIAKDEQRVAQVHHNLASLFLQAGRAEKALEHVEAALRVPTGRRRHLWHRSLRVTALLQLDRASEAREELATLVSDCSGREHTAEAFLVRHDRALCALHQGERRVALGELRDILEEPACPSVIFAQAAGNWADAVLDLGALELVRETPEPAALPREGSDLLLRVGFSRLHALRAQAHQDGESARAELEGSLDVAGRLAPRVRARFLNHLAVLLLESGPESLERAERLLLEALDVLGAREHAYDRGRLCLNLARTLQAGGDEAAALHVLDRIVPQARRLGCRGLLADALRARAALHVSPEAAA